MTQLLLSPHNDDETLFAAYVCLRHRPRVLTVIDGARKRHAALPALRAAESAAAMRTIGCEYEHLGFPLEETDWDAISARLAEEPAPDRVWAPWPEENGHRHHNRLGELAFQLWPGKVSFYTTYVIDPDSGYPTRTVTGAPVDIDEGWDDVKRRALDHYQSQIQQDGTRMHFERSLDEYVVPALRLNLGGGINPLPGFVNLDKTAGWRFETGLIGYPDASVEAITESHALMYVELEHWPFVFSEINRVLVPGGTVRMTHDAIGAPGSTRTIRRPGAALATTLELLLAHLAGAGFSARIVAPNETGYRDETLIQQNYGSPPDVFHVEAVKNR